MLELNLPKADFRIKKDNNNYLIFDTFRKRYIILTPEEWVRQNFLRFLVDHRGFPEGRIAVEKEIIINKMSKRCDAIVYDKYSQEQVLLEFKASDIPISQEVLDQAAVYNRKLGVEYIILSNGIQHIFCRIEKESGKHLFYNAIPHYEDINEQK